MEGRRSSKASKAIREWTQFAVLLFATVWGVYTFVYKETILPARRPATLTVTATLEELARNDEQVLIRLRIHAVNHTDRKVYVPALWYRVRGVSLSPQEGDAEAFISQITQVPQAELNARYSSVARSDVVAVGTVLSSITGYYEPTDETTNEVLFEVPADSYDALEAKAQFFVTRDTQDLAIAGWNVDAAGELEPQLVLAGRPYEPLYNAQHHAWALSSGAGFNWSSSTLATWQSGAQAAATSSEPRLTSRH